MSTNPEMTVLPFDFQELNDATKQQQTSKKSVKWIHIHATDEVELAVRVYEPTNSGTIASLVFYHGGGAHSGAGYSLLAYELSEKYNVKVYTPDLRGHGASGGARGDSPTVYQIWKDVDSVIDHVVETENDDHPILLGGHSSGGGLVLNYATWEHRRNADFLKGYVLVSPQLGHLAHVERPIIGGRTPFAKVNITAFIVNGIFGWFGHAHAVQFAYPKEVLEGDPGMVAFNTVNMANAITPTSPKTQFSSIGNTPLALWVGNDDEMFLPEKVASFAQGKPNLSATVLPGKTHLGILVDVAGALGPWIVSLVSE